MTRANGNDGGAKPMREGVVAMPADGDVGRAARGRISLLGVVFSLVALGAVVVWAKRQGPPAMPSSTDALLAAVAAVAVYMLATAVRGERWYLLLKQIGAAPRRRDCYGLTAVGYMGNNVLPVRGGDVLRIYLLARRAGVGKREVIGSLIAERILDVMTLLGIFGVLAYGVLGGVYAPQPWHALVAGAAGALALAAALAGAAIARRRRLFERARDYVRPMTISSRRLRGRGGLVLVALTLAIWALEAGTYFAVAVAVDFELTPLEALYLVALVGLFVVLPAGPGNAGTLDAGIVIGASALGAAGGVALAYLLMLRFVLFVPVTLTGLVILVTRYGGWESVRGTRALAGRA